MGAQDTCPQLPTIAFDPRGTTLRASARPSEEICLSEALRESLRGLCRVSPRALRGLSEGSWKATKEYLNQRGTKIRVFRVRFRTPFLPPFFPHFSPPLSPSGPVYSRTTSPLFTSPFIPPFLASGKVRFRYPSDIGTL